MRTREGQVWDALSNYTSAPDISFTWWLSWSWVFLLVISLCPLTPPANNSRSRWERPGLLATTQSSDLAAATFTSQFWGETSTWARPSHVFLLLVSHATDMAKTLLPSSGIFSACSTFNPSGHPKNFNSFPQIFLWPFIELCSKDGISCIVAYITFPLI